MLEALAAEFSDVPDAAQATRLVVRLLVAGIMGAIIGYDRERNASPAGSRPPILVARGAALFVIAPAQAGFSADDVSRVVQGIVAGIGFLGAGAILKQDANKTVGGPHTAASIWLTAAIGIAAGLGQVVTAIVATLFGLIVLGVMRKPSGPP